MSQKRKHTNSRAARPPGLRETDKWLKVKEFCELYQIAPVVRNSYVLSRFWAWASRIEVAPTVRIPIPRFFAQRDP